MKTIYSVWLGSLVKAKKRSDEETFLRAEFYDRPPNDGVLNVQCCLCTWVTGWKVALREFGLMDCRREDGVKIKRYSIGAICQTDLRWTDAVTVTVYRFHSLRGCVNLLLAPLIDYSSSIVLTNKGHQRAADVVVDSTAQL
jgi:hypothetical protein